MKSYEFNGHIWVSCQECEYGAYGAVKSCSVGINIDDAVYFDHGCWAGELMERVTAQDMPRVSDSTNETERSRG
ncbi:MAG: hypothetical protein NC320_09010 [Clostridium sp.]|nr:hypothetical protein [Clostridium sp.]MCM1547934.1 hypothetical protein [Ruminococcus sp.]